MNRRYDFVLDLYPLLVEFPDEARVLVARIEHVAFNLLENMDFEDVKRLRLLLRVARDLGYLDDRLYFFLEKRTAML